MASCQRIWRQSPSRCMSRIFRKKLQVAYRARTVWHAWSWRFLRCPEKQPLRSRRQDAIWFHICLAKPATLTETECGASDPAPWNYRLDRTTGHRSYHWPPWLEFEVRQPFKQLGKIPSPLLTSNPSISFANRGIFIVTTKCCDCGLSDTFKVNMINYSIASMKQPLIRRNNRNSCT